MKRNILKFGLPASLALIVTACGGSGDDIAGIGGSGFVSSGSVSGFGSVYVNGDKFETTSSTFDVDDASATQNSLREGMVVQVYGSINADGTGIATRILYDNDIEGPITSLTQNADLTEITFSVMGTTVVASSTDTVFEGTTFDTLADNNVIEVSGYYDDNGELQATYIEFKATTFNAAEPVEIKGVIKNLSGTSFMINAVNVDASAANLSDLPDGLANGEYVEVKGLYDTTSNTIAASEVEAEDNEIGDANRASVEGYVTRFVSLSDFDINGYPVNAGTATFNPVQLANRLALGAKIEAEGSVSNGVLSASYIEIRGGEVKIKAEANGIVDTVNRTFEIAIIGTAITIEITDASSTEDDQLSADDLDLATVATGDKLEVRGFETTSGHVIATKVKRMSSSEVIDTILQGYVTDQVNGSSVTVLGVQFPVDGTTKFEDDNDVTYAGGHSDLIAASTNNESIIKIKDKVEDTATLGTANEVELEKP